MAPGNQQCHNWPLVNQNQSWIQNQSSGSPLTPHFSLQNSLIKYSLSQPLHPHLIIITIHDFPHTSALWPKTLSEKNLDSLSCTLIFQTILMTNQESTSFNLVNSSMNVISSRVCLKKICIVIYNIAMYLCHNSFLDSSPWYAHQHVQQHQHTYNSSFWNMTFQPRHNTPCEAFHSTRMPILDCTWFAL